MNVFGVLLLNFVLLASTCTILLMFLSPMGFETMYARQWIGGKGQNSTKAKRDDDWPQKMKLHLVSFVCNPPDPNMEISKVDLNAAWNLPPKTRLSSIMVNVGRCKIAARSMRENGRIFFDLDKCYCVDLPWAFAIFTVNVVALFFYTITCFFGTCCGIGNAPNLFELRTGRCFAVLWMMIWYVALTIYALRNVDAGLSYTLYGDMFPKAYYQREPIAWFAIFVLCLINCTAEGIKFLVYATNIRQIKEDQSRQESQRPSQMTVAIETDPLPPTYESVLLDGVGKKNDAEK